jgi:hypothetical protein
VIHHKQFRSHSGEDSQSLTFQCRFIATNEVGRRAARLTPQAVATQDLLAQLCCTSPRVTLAPVFSFDCPPRLPAPKPRSVSLDVQVEIYEATFSVVREVLGSLLNAWIGLPCGRM